MGLDPSIILSGQQFDLMGAINAGRESAMQQKAFDQQQKAFDQQNALAELYRTQGAGMLAGDQNSLNALAQYDPAAALGLKQTQTQMAYSAEDQQMQRENAKREAERYAKTISAEQAAQEAAQVEAEVKRALAAPDAATFDAMVTQMGMPEMAGMYDQREMLAIPYLDFAETLKMVNPERPEWRAATPAEAAANGAVAGQINTKTGKFDAQSPPSGMTMTTNPDGTMTFSQGPGVVPGAGPTSGDALRTSATDAESMLALIDEIAKDPALASVTGSIEGGGGNNVDEFGMGRRMWYGDKGLAVIQKIAQLQGNAWLGARALLKGGGAITDYESKKAEGAMARLSRAQGDAEFKAALKDLNDALRDGVAKLQGVKPGEAAGSGSPPPAGGFDPAEIDQLMNGP